MKKTLSTVAVVACLIALVSLAGITALRLQRTQSYAGCSAYANALAALKSERNAATSDEARHTVDIKIADVKQQQATDTNCASSDVSAADTATASATSSATSSPSETPTAEATSNATSTTSSSDDTWEPHYYFNDANKSSVGSFGSAVDSTTAVDDFRTRLTSDPVLACADGGQIVNDADGGLSCVQELLKSKSARDNYISTVFANIKEMHVETMPAGTADWGAYMVIVDGIPAVDQRGSIYYPTAYDVLVVTTQDGREYLYRLACGYQWTPRRDVVASSSTETTTQPQSTTVTAAPTSDTPYVVAPDCVNGGTRDEGGNCVVPETPTTTTTTPTTTETTPPSETPTLSPKSGSNPGLNEGTSESNTVNDNDGATDSQGYQSDPSGDADKAAADAAQANQDKQDAADTAASQASVDSGAGSEPQGPSSTDDSSGTTSTGSAGEDTSGSVWDDN